MNMKKLFLLNLPYLLFVYPFDTQPLEEWFLMQLFTIL